YTLSLHDALPIWRSCPASVHDGAAGHVDRLARDVLGAVAGEERDDFGDVGWQRDTAEWDRGGLLRDALGPQRRIEAPIGPAAEMVETLGVGGARTHGVHGDAGRREPLGERL